VSSCGGGYSARASAIAFRISFDPGSVGGAKRAITRPSLPTRNFVKFHWMSPGPSGCELVAREAQHHEAVAGVLLVELLQALVVRGEAAPGGDVHDEGDLAAVVPEGAIVSVEGLLAEIVERGGGHASVYCLQSTRASAR
jgi:hypothetical protein